MEKNQKISIQITTTDKQGNEILSQEVRVFSISDSVTLVNYINLFISVLRKQEFSTSEIQKSLHEYFINVDKKDFPG